MIRHYRAPKKHLIERLTLPMNRKQLVSPALRKELEAENQTLALTLANTSSAITRFANSMSHLDQDAKCNPALYANVLDLTYSHRNHAYLRSAYSSRQLDMSKARLEAAVDHLDPEMARALVSPVDLPTIMDAQRFDKMSSARTRGHALLRVILDTLDEAYRMAHSGTIGDVGQALQNVACQLNGRSHAENRLAA
jgi:hypothetical protein